SAGARTVAVGRLHRIAGLRHARLDAGASAERLPAAADRAAGHADVCTGTGTCARALHAGHLTHLPLQIFEIGYSDVNPVFNCPTLPVQRLSLARSSSRTCGASS